MLKKYITFPLLLFVLVSCGGGSGTSPITVEVSMEASSETAQYNETYTISWTSDASQCYASGAWSGEKSPSGSENFVAKTNGPVGYGIECRKNNTFAQAQAVVTLEKDFINGFDFLDDEITELLTIEHSDGVVHKISSHYIGDFNNDNAQDMILAYRVNDPRDNATALYPRFFQILGGEELTISELETDGCQSGELFATGDYNIDGFQDIVALPTKTVKTIDGEPVDSNICFFVGSGSGLDTTRWNSIDFIDNSSSIDLNNFAVTSWDPVDISGDGSVDLLLWAKEGHGSSAGLPFYIISNTATNAFVQLSTNFVELDPYLPSTGCLQDLSYLCDWKNFIGTSQIYFDDNTSIDIVGSACGEDLSSCSYTNFTERFEEGNDFDWSISNADVLTPSVNSGQSFSKKLSIVDNNSDGLYDIVILENDFKFSVYERIDGLISAQDTGDFLSLLSSSNIYTSDWLLVDLDLDTDFDLLAPINCVEQTCTNKMFSVFEKSPLNTDRVTDAGEITFTAADGSQIITVNDVGHNTRFGRSITFSGAEGLGGAITSEILNGQFTVTSTPSDDTYTIEASVAANSSDTGDGGTSVVGTYVDISYLWTEEDVTAGITFPDQTVNTFWFDSNGDNDIDVISITESKNIATGTNVPLSTTYKIYHHKNDTLR